MRKLMLILLFVSTLLNAQSLLLFDKSEPELNPNPNLDYTETLTYTSNFSADLNNWSASRATVTGNNDAISDGATSNNDVLKMYASADNNTHRIFYTDMFSNYISVKKITFDAYIPSSNTNADGVFINNAGVASGTYVKIFNITCKKVADNSDFGTVANNNMEIRGIKGYWVSVTMYVQLFTYNTFGVGMLKGALQTFAGANSSTDDIVYIKNFKYYNLTIPSWTLSNTNSTDYILGSASGLKFVEATGETKITMSDTLDVGYYKLKVTQDWTQGQLWAFNGTTTYDFPQSDGEYTVKIYLPGDKPLVIGCDNNTISTISSLSIK